MPMMDFGKTYLQIFTSHSLKIYWMDKEGHGHIPTAKNGRCVGMNGFLV